MELFWNNLIAERKKFFDMQIVTISASKRAENFWKRNGRIFDFSRMDILHALTVMRKNNLFIFIFFFNSLFTRFEKCIYAPKVDSSGMVYVSLKAVPNISLIIGLKSNTTSLLLK